MASELPTPLHIIQDSRHAIQDGWLLDDISLCSSGKIVVSVRHLYQEDQSYLSIYGSGTDDNSDSRDKPTLLYHKQFTHKELAWRRRCISFIESTEIVTCQYNEVQVIDFNRDVVLRSRKVNGDTACLSVSESQIFIGLVSDIVNIYDNDLNEIKSISLKVIKRDCAEDISAAHGRLYVCTYRYPGRAIVYSRDSGNILTEYTTGQGGSEALSMAVDIKLGLTAVLWSPGATGQTQIILYLLSENKSSLTVNVESGVSRIRISSDQGRIVTGNVYTGEVKIYNLVNLFSYSHLKENLVSGLGRYDCKKLAAFFAIGGEELKVILNTSRPALPLLHALEEKGVIQASRVDRLQEAFLRLEMSQSFYHAVNFYQKLNRAQITSYDRFLATLSTHLTSSALAALCGFFHVRDEQKFSIISSENPGLSLLLVLDEMGVITPSEVGCLEEPFNELRLVQALAKIDEYKEIVNEGNRKLLQTVPLSLEDKRTLFVEFVKKKVKSWYETMTPVPWKKSCQWKSTDLFVGSGLILTDSKANQNVQNIDEQCKLNYTEIFTNEKLKYEIRIILEGDPGAGKTMLSSQLAYDWSEGKIDGADILIFLPLKIVENKTLIQAVKEFYVPANTPLSGDDIESILASDTERICLLLDGLEEYSTGGWMRLRESSEVMKIMKKEKHSNCKVVVTSRSDFAHDLPECPLLKLGRFGETERNSYIEKLFPYDVDQQQKIKRIIQDNPFILDLCSVPLLFVLVVHNIESLRLSKRGQLNKVSPFMSGMILTLCSSSSVKHEVGRKQSEVFERETMTLGKLAFNGLCKGHQQLTWHKAFMEDNVGSLKQWVDSGILVLEEGFVMSEKENQDTSEIYIGKKLKEKTTNENRKGTPDELLVLSENMVSASIGESKPRHDVSKIDSEEQHQSVSQLETEPHVKKKMAVGGAASQLPQFLRKILQRMKGNIKNETRKKSDELPGLPVDMSTLPMGAPKPGHDISKIEEQHQSVSELETEPHEIKKKTGRRAAAQVPLTVKFLHKVIQEWFAASFFSSVMRRCTSEDQFQNYVSSYLQNISPTDLHYVLRFTSYLHPPSCHVIMKYLLRSYRKDGSVPPYIMNCVFLCFNEYNTVKGPDMKNAVKDVCKEVIRIQSEDSRSLQQAKCALLEYASNNGVILERLDLEDVIFAVNETRFTLNSGVQLGILHTVKLIKVSRWDQILREDDYKNILKLLSAGKLLKKVCCIFPSQPPDSLDEITLGNIVSKDLKVEWHIGYLVQSLDPRTSKWMINFKQPGTSSKEIIEVSAGPAIWSVETTITNDGGLLKIPRTDVQLIVPPGAFEEDRSECLIRLSIVLPGKHDEASTSFCSNSSTIVELLPNNLTLKLPVKLTLPHCLKLKKGFQNKVKIYMSHHEGDAQPRWEEVVDPLFLLDDKKCTIWMKTFCWTKYTIDDEVVEAKRITIFTAAEPFHVPDDIAEIQVGYHLDLPGAGEILRLNPSLIVGQRMPYLFLREGKHPLKVFLSTIAPKTWTYLTPEDNPQEIPFRSVALSVEYSCPFILQHDTDTTKVPTCIFKASQDTYIFKLQIRPKVVTSQKQPSGIHSEAEAHHQDNVTTQVVENSAHCDNLKESPQDASLQLSSTIPWKTSDAVVRREQALQEYQHERDRYAGSNLEPLRQPEEVCQNVFQTHGQTSPYHEYQMLPRSGLPSPVPIHPLIQHNYFHQNYSISPFGAPVVGGQSLFEFPDQVNPGEVRLGYSLLKALGRKLDPVDPLGNNWKELADKLRFTMEDIGVFELAPSPTLAVIECAIKRSKLKSIDQLKTILDQIGRTDASSLLMPRTPEDENEN